MEREPRQHDGYRQVAWLIASAGACSLALLAAQVASRFESGTARLLMHGGDVLVAWLLWRAACEAALRLARLPGGEMPLTVEAWSAGCVGGLSALLLVLAAAGRVPVWADGFSALGKVLLTLLAVRLTVRVSRRLQGMMPLRGVVLDPPSTVVASFALAILCGWILLCLPQAAATGQPMGPLDALFTATSATCVTGLIVKDTPRDFSLLGHLVILALIQVGGLGIMTLAGVFDLARGQRVSLHQRMIARDTAVVPQGQSVAATLRAIVLFALSFELAGAVALGLRWWAGGEPAGRAAWLAVFHATSAFCNAGFSLFSNSLEDHAGDFTVNAVVGGLIVVGGLGFPLVADLVRYARGRRRGRRSRLSLHSRLVLVTTAWLLGLGFAGFLYLEWHNALSAHGPLESVYAAAFQSVTARTAGFNTVSMGSLTETARLLLVLLMFIGSSPGSTGGGIKTATFAVVACLARTMIHGGSVVAAFGRSIPEAVRHRAVAIVILFGMSVLAWTLLLSVTERGPLLDILFETVSAFATVGLSTGITSRLTAFGRLAIIAAMFMGRVGPLTLALAVAQKRGGVELRYPEDPVMVG